MMPSTIPAMFIDVCNRFSGDKQKTAFSYLEDGTEVELNHDELRHQVESFASGLLLLGFDRGERIGIISENRIEWVIADLAMSAAGIIDVPIFPTLTAKQIKEIYLDCSASAIIVSNLSQANKVLSVWDELPLARKLILMNDITIDHPDVVSMNSVMHMSSASSSKEERRTRFSAMCENVKTSDLLTIIYTSGTTGVPKGVMLTHGNLTANIEAARSVITIDHTDTLLSYLPLCHSYERMSGYYLAFACGATVSIVESIEAVAERMKVVRPTVMTSVPRLFERIQMRVLAAVEKGSTVKKRIFHWGMKVGERVYSGETGMLLSIQSRLADKLVYSKIRARTGGRLRFFVSGGAALSLDVGRFFGIIGITIIEGYGLTETSPVIAVHRLDDVVLGTVGPPLPNVEVKIAHDGEILTRGPCVMKGYWNNETATREIIDTDGWLHTGDIGRVDERGHVRITDRKKHILVSSGGKNISPQPIEAIALKSPFIEQVLVIGDGREYCTALIVPEVTACESWATGKNRAYDSWMELVQSEELHRAIEDDLRQLQKDLPKFERIRRFHVVNEPFTIENGFLTPTLKVRRSIVLEAYSVEIERLYNK